MGSVGFPRHLIASLFSNSIGAADTMLNGITTSTVKDFIRSTFGKQLIETQVDSITTYVFLGYCLLSMSFIYFMNELDGSLQIFFHIVRVTGGIGIGAAILGAFFPWANFKGVMGGTISSIAYLAWATFELQAQGYSDLERHFSSNVGINNETLTTHNEIVEEIISGCAAYYIWHTSMSIIIFIITGIVIGGLTDFQDPKEFNQNLLSPSVKSLSSYLPPILRMALYLLCNKMTVVEHTEQDK